RLEDVLDHFSGSVFGAWQLFIKQTLCRSTKSCVALRDGILQRNRAASRRRAPIKNARPFRLPRNVPIQSLEYPPNSPKGATDARPRKRWDNPPGRQETRGGQAR